MPAALAQVPESFDSDRLGAPASRAQVVRSSHNVLRCTKGT